MKKQIIKLNESQLRKMIREAISNDIYGQQWKNEIKAFMDGLRSGDYFVDNDTVYVQIWRKRTAENDPRYVYFRRGDTCLHDDHFCV